MQDGDSADAPDISHYLDKTESHLEGIVFTAAHVLGFVHKGKSAWDKKTSDEL